MPTAQCLKSRHFQGSKRHRIGQTTVEFALICLPFFVILFAIIDYAQIYFYENALQNAMRESARFATAGRIIQNYTNGVAETELNSNGFSVPKAINDSSGREASRNECIKYWFLSNCVIRIPLSNITIVSAPTLTGVPPTVSTNSLGQLNLLLANGSTPNLGPGAANDYEQVTATYTISTITPLFNYLGGYSRSSNGNYNTFPVHVSAIVKNEPSLLNFQHLAIYGTTNSSGEQ